MSEEKPKRTRKPKTTTEGETPAPKAPRKRKAKDSEAAPLIPPPPAPVRPMVRVSDLMQDAPPPKKPWLNTRGCALVLFGILCGALFLGGQQAQQRRAEETRVVMLTVDALATLITHTPTNTATPTDTPTETFTPSQKTNRGIVQNSGKDILFANSYIDSLTSASNFLKSRRR